VRELGRVEPGEHRLFHLGRQVRALGGDRVANILGGLLDRLLEFEEDGARRESIGPGAGGLLPVHAADAEDGILYRIDDLAGDFRGRCARVHDSHAHDRLLNVGELIGVQVEQGKDAEYNQRHHGGDSHDRALNGKIGDEHQRRTSSSVILTGLPSVTA
jgi:hypothetical protein